MLRSIRHKLHGTYSTPRYRLGQRVECEARGTVQIVGTSAGRIPWPIGRKGRSVSLVIYGDLYRAIQAESPTAVAYHWGVSVRVVSRWRSALGIAGKRTEGSKRLRAECGKDLAVLKAGKPRAPETIAKMRVANVGKVASEATRAKMRAAAKGRRPPWLNPAWSPREERRLHVPAERGGTANRAVVRGGLPATERAGLARWKATEWQVRMPHRQAIFEHMCNQLSRTEYMIRGTLQQTGDSTCYSQWSQTE